MSTDAARMLYESDRAYFAAGARVLPFAGGAARWMPGLAHLAAGCVVEADGTVPVAPFADAAREAALSIGAPLLRIYRAHEDDRDWEREGFHRADELAFARRPVMSAPDPAVAVRPVVTCDDWSIKQAMAAANGDLPDGKSASSEEWSLLERRKSAAGYARFYLAEIGGEPCATFALADRRPLLRIKNVVVLPRWRGRGVGRALMEFALRHGAVNAFDWVGVYALAHGPGCRLYESCGFSRVGCQVEWTRAVGAAAAAGDQTLGVAAA